MRGFSVLGLIASVSSNVGTFFCAYRDLSCMRIFNVMTRKRIMSGIR